ncbi:DUF2478 domain-containing protein [Sulfitobacter sp. M57]|uniref:DUF2478 domain-containing protein n=1 Tax=unclassified Sulfitobacter TaxID=196795 RepID=UPI0023E13565|nr:MULTISPECIES: DUF2478 domain-containing protein [unclassified Sulfitobacter]MDF3414600.1 DUF2478 domain-containing protein [Sulfitobacter sp. KE5]MDF3422082.1 DUF2478 domain-containing protein [Sulfitobacter sp. KE43]MDF3433147.1 DUF2478 domain-containing protein [Sulfitobacter sp. KE42]MDF3458787.1 DUF2478 domain-containing protein [Sulfitobacter sp. S74]MDF3462686.1 DUF2478 domain-containing protein [Sulfitobacter sp. Ks18]
MSLSPLAAIRLEHGDIDTFLEGIAKTLTKRGLNVRGAVQTRGVAGGECHCADMDLTTFGSLRTFRISQPLGNGSHGCRLHPGALAECSEFIERELVLGADLLILNRFGRGESEGRGFRDLISKAIALDVPVLTAVRPTYAQSWSEFGEGIACNLPMNQAAVLHWFATVQEARDAA